MLCRECGATSTQGDSFCKACGHDLGATALLTSLVDSTERPALEIVREALIADFEVKNLIGRGGMGLVFRAQERSLKREVALKVLPFAHVHDEMLVTRFTNEARTAAKLEHPNIVPVYRVGRSGDVIYFAMKYLNGPSLTELIVETGPLAPSEIRRILIECARALGYAHGHGVVHRDVKPDNIIFKESGEVVVCDFGIARAATGSKLTGTGMALGTPYYMSPEQFRARPLDGRSDIYSLGVVGYQCLTKCVPFEGEDSFAIGYKHVTEPLAHPDLKTAEDRSLFAIVERMMAKEPSDRYENAQALIEELSSGATTQAAPAGRTSDPAKEVRNPPFSELSTRPVNAVVPPVRPKTRRPSSPSANDASARSAGSNAPAFRRSSARLRRPRQRTHDRSSVVIATVAVLGALGLGTGGYFLVNGSGGFGEALSRARTTALTGLSYVPVLRNYVSRPDTVASPERIAPVATPPIDSGVIPLGVVQNDSGAVTDTAGGAQGDSTVEVAVPAPEALTEPIQVPTPDQPGTTAPIEGQGLLRLSGVVNTGQVWIDGVSVRGLEHSLEPGAHEVIVQAPGYVRYRNEVVVRAGETEIHRVEMVRETQCERFDDSYNRDGSCFDTPARPAPEQGVLVTLPEGLSPQGVRPVTVLMRILEDGRVERATQHIQSNIPEFTIAALEFAKEMRFLPAQRGDRAVASFVLIELHPEPGT